MHKDSPSSKYVNFQAQAMKEQAQLREEMAYQYKLGNFEVRLTVFILVVQLILICLIIDSKPTYIYRPRLLFKEG